MRRRASSEEQITSRTRFFVPPKGALFHKARFLSTWHAASSPAAVSPSPCGPVRAVNHLPPAGSLIEASIEAVTTMDLSYIFGSIGTCAEEEATPQPKPKMVRKRDQMQLRVVDFLATVVTTKMWVVVWDAGEYGI